MSDIIAALAKFGEIEWCSCNMGDSLFADYPELSSFPPVIVWRYKTPSPQVAEKLSTVIASFHGITQWSLNTERKNWVLCPSRVHNRDDVVRLKKFDPEYGIQANKDLSKLADYIDCA